MGGKRIFPGKTNSTDTNSHRNYVNLVAQVELAVPGVTVYFKVWDMGDPFDHLYGPNHRPGVDEIPGVSTLDPGTDDRMGNDNRGGSGGLVGSAITDENGRATKVLITSRQPGDNYRAAATCLQHVLTDAPDFTPRQVTQADADLLGVRTGPTGGFVANGDFAGYQVPVVWSPMLTVWRKLHVELDSMGPVTNNHIDSPFTGIVGSGAALTEINGLNSLDDRSANLDKVPPGNGRFENGTLVIGTAPNTITISPVTANGSNRVVFPPTSIAGLPFSAVDNDDWGNGTISGTIADVSKSGINFAWVLNVTAHNEDPIDWADFVGGTLTLGGGAEVVIVAANAATSQFTTSTLRIPCRIHDDDDDTLLPKLPDTSAMASAYEAAYVLPVYDVGNSEMNVPFVLNVPEDPIASFGILRWDSKPQNAPDFWVAYVLEGFQSSSTADFDPNSEESSYGDTHESDGGSIIYIEVHQGHEGVANPVEEERDTVVHETAHAVGCSADEPVTDGNSNMTAPFLGHIRSAIRPYS